MSKLRVDIWSDIACPWCYVGKRRLEAALERFPHRDEVEVVWRAFELDPSAPAVRDSSVSYAARLASKYGTTVPAAETMIARMTRMAQQDGLNFDFSRAQSGNTFEAHRLLHLAQERGLQDRVKERLFRAYLSEGEAIGLPDTLVRLGSEAGLDAEEISALLATDLYAAEVRADEQEARDLGIQGVPFFVIGRYGITGAQPADVLLDALKRAFDELPQPEFTEGAVCGPERCAPANP